MANERIPPPLIATSRVLHYAIVDAEVRYTRSSVLYSGGKEVGPVPRLAISRSLVDDSILLLHCDQDWNCLGASGGGSVEDVMNDANRLYEGLAAKWMPAPYTDVAFLKAFADDYESQRCSFCGRYHFEMGGAGMIQGAQAWICTDCVERFHGVVLEREKSPAEPAP